MPASTVGILVPALLCTTLCAAACLSGDGNDGDDASPTTPLPTTPVPTHPTAEAPVLELLAPTSGAVGTAVTLTGLHFGDEPGTTGVVHVGGIPATTQSWSDTSIVLTVPAGLYPGDRDVDVVTDGGTSNVFVFAVELPRAVYINDDTSPFTGPNVIEAFLVASTGVATPIGAPIFQAVDGPGYGGSYAGTLALHASTLRVLTTAFGVITSWDVEPATGALIEADTLEIDGDYPYGLQFTTDGTRAYVVEFDTSVVVGFSVAADGTMAPLPGSPYDAGSIAGTSAMEFSVDQSFLYTLNESVGEGSIHGFLVGKNGALAELPGSPYDQPDRSYALVRAPNADRYYLPLVSYIAVYEPDAEGDLVENVDLRESTPERAYIGFSGSGDRLFSVMRTSPTPNEAQMYVYDVSATGVMVNVSGSPFTLTGYPAAASMVRANSDGSLLLVKGPGQAAFHLYTIDGAGVPTEVSGSPYSLEAGAEGSGVAFTF